jgi:hypothetical protein
MLTRVCADFSRAISCATTKISARSSHDREPGRSSSGESRGTGSGESRGAGAAADFKCARRGTCRAGISGRSYFTGRARRDSYRDVKPCTNHRSEPFAGCRRKNQWRRAWQ